MATDKHDTPLARARSAAARRWLFDMQIDRPRPALRPPKYANFYVPTAAAAAAAANGLHR